MLLLTIIIPQDRIVTSASRPCTSPADALTKFHTSEANWWTPPISPEPLATSSDVLDDALTAGEVVVTVEVCEGDILPVVVRMAPLVRSRAIVARTPAFFESRPRDSSN
jgi:hypothetical protein